MNVTEIHNNKNFIKPLNILNGNDFKNCKNLSISKLIIAVDLLQVNFEKGWYQTSLNSGHLE